MDLSLNDTGATMKCPQLNRRPVAACKVLDGTYVPSEFQLQEYCKSKKHKKCPFYARLNAGKANNAI
ncbi:MAG: hypothetical protein M1508_07210 [Nitrospirae bacterium]|nr:hypothetical protein [Nitrospirota bacterium]